jgi:hypothetical protein
MHMPAGIGVRQLHRAIAALCALLVLGSCLGTSATGLRPRLIGEGRRALFIGNSYLYTMDIPGIVQAMADSAHGDQIAVETVAAPDYALLDHWNEGTARREIAKGGWEWVIMQQGPSSVEVNRDTLRLAAKLFADVMSDGTPALFSAWPSQPRRQDFDRAIESYRIAAADVAGMYIPVAAAWVAAWRRSPDLGLYADALHPSPEGAYLSALVVYGKLLGQSPLGLPHRLVTRGKQLLHIDPAVAHVLQEAANEVLQVP